METINVLCGKRVIADNGSIHYIGGITDNGECYKDEDAWKNGGVIYIGEYQLIDLDNGSNRDELWTKENWLKWVADEVANTIGEGCPKEFIEYLAECVWQECDWQDLSTLLCEIDINESYDSWIENE